MRTGVAGWYMPHPSDAPYPKPLTPIPKPSFTEVNGAQVWGGGTCPTPAMRQTRCLTFLRPCWP